jgi:hypothetical protein
LDARFAGSNPAKDEGFLKEIKSVGRLLPEGKSASCLKILQHVEDPAERDRDISPTKLVDFFAKFLPASLLDVSVDFPESSGG